MPDVEVRMVAPVTSYRAKIGRWAGPWADDESTARDLAWAKINSEGGANGPRGFLSRSMFDASVSIVQSERRPGRILWASSSKAIAEHVRTACDGDEIVVRDSSAAALARRAIQGMRPELRVKIVTRAKEEV